MLAPTSERCPALVLVGPTGSGKTPLGELLEAEGFCGRRCLHFDFGANLRRQAQGRGTRGRLSRGEREFLKLVLKSGTLLEDEQFPVARKVLLDFLESRGARLETLLVLNGLPRHVGQAQALDGVVAVELVVQLVCTAQAAHARIRSNIGGDRAGRADDTLRGVRERLAVFRRRTAPLISYYAGCGVRVARIAVGAATTAEEMRAAIESLGRRVK